MTGPTTYYHQTCRDEAPAQLKHVAAGLGMVARRQHNRCAGHDAQVPLELFRQYDAIVGAVNALHLFLFPACAEGWHVRRVEVSRVEWSGVD
jgi:hypothetical protein